MRAHGNITSFISLKNKERKMPLSSHNKNIPASSDLIRAAKEGDVEMMRYLLKRGAPIDGRDEAGSTALIWAVWTNQVESVRFLIGQKADLNVENNRDYGQTALRAAAEMGRTEIARLLIDAGADINARRWSGESALLLAARGNHTEIVRMLVAKNANRSFQDGSGATALAYARRNRNAEMEKILGGSPGHQNHHRI